MSANAYECRAGCARTLGRRRAGLDGRTGRVVRAPVDPGSRRDHRSWIRSLPGPVAVTYEAGPTGFGLARFLTGQGIDCQVAAPSKLQRPSGDRVKTDVRDARHLARLLHLGEIVAVTVPERRAGGGAGSGAGPRGRPRGSDVGAAPAVETAAAPGDRLLRRQAVDRYRTIGGCAPSAAARCSPRPGLGLAFDIAYDTMLATVARRDRLDAAITEMAADQRVHPGGDPAGVPARGVDVDRVRAGGRDRRLAPVDRPLDRRLPRAGAHRVLLRRARGRRGRSPRPATGTPAGC